MIIYNKTGLANLYVQEQAKEAQDAGLITKSEERSIEENYPTGFYTPNRVVRIGFFLLTLIGSLFTGVLIGLIFGQTYIISQQVWPFLLGLGTYASTEFFVKDRHLFRSGIDDALLWLTAGLLTGGFISSVSNSSNQYLFTSGFTLLLSLFFTFRFADRIMAVVANISFLALVFFAGAK